MSKLRQFPDRTTADGVVVKRGDRVWSTRTGSLSRPTTVTTSLLAVWTWWGMDKESFADERAAILHMLATSEKQLNRAKQDVKRETKTIARLAGRLAALDSTATQRRGE